MSRHEKKSALPPPSTVPPSPAAIVEVYGNSGRPPVNVVDLRTALSPTPAGGRLRVFADDLILRLADEDPRIVRAARAALKELSGADHGPEPEAPAGDREAAQAAWWRWLDAQR
jgi:hypothetical protein